MGASSQPKGLLLIGGGGHCRSVLDVLQLLGFPVAGIVDNDHELLSVLDIPVIGTDADLLRLRQTHEAALITVGQIKTAAVRQKLYRMLSDAGFTMPSIVSPLAHVSARACLGAGTVVLHRAVVNACAQVGKNCIINTGAIVEHDAMVEDHSHISTGAVLNGGAHVGEGSFVGSGALVREGVSIGSACVIGMGACVRHDMADGSVVWGNV